MRKNVAKMVLLLLLCVPLYAANPFLAPSDIKEPVTQPQFQNMQPPMPENIMPKLEPAIVEKKVETERVLGYLNGVMIVKTSSGDIIHRQVQDTGKLIGTTSVKDGFERVWAYTMTGNDIVSSNRLSHITKEDGKVQVTDKKMHVSICNGSALQVNTKTYGPLWVCSNQMNEVENVDNNGKEIKKTEKPVDVPTPLLFVPQKPMQKVQQNSTSVENTPKK